MRSGIRRTTTMEAKFDAQKNLDKLIESLNGKTARGIQVKT